jgi:hypothetical protein
MGFNSGFKGLTSLAVIWCFCTRCMWTDTRFCMYIKNLQWFDDNIRRHRKKNSHLGDQPPGICASLLNVYVKWQRFFQKNTCLYLSKWPQKWIFIKSCVSPVQSTQPKFTPITDYLKRHCTSTEGSGFWTRQHVHKRSGRNTDHP